MRGVLPNLEPPQELRQISAHSNNKKKQARVTVSQADCTRFEWKRQSRWSLTHSLHFDNIHTGVWVVSSGTDQSCQFVRKVDTPCNAQVTERAQPNLGNGKILKGPESPVFPLIFFHQG